MASCAVTLPASWYTSKAVYSLEKRAVFLKSWFLMGAVSKWPYVGEDYTRELAQIKYTIRRSTPDWRSITVFSESGSEIRSYLTSGGLLFMTLSDETVSLPEFYPGLEEKINHLDFTDLPLRRPLTYVGDYNWKAMVDGYQECLHCGYAHPEFAKVYLPSLYKVVNYHNYSQHLCKPGDANDDGLFFYLFPNSTLSIYGGGMTSWRVCPSDDPSRSVMEFDYYHTAPVDSKEFENYYKFTRDVALEDIELCERVQDNLNRGIYTEGLLNPARENGVSFYQGKVLEMCTTQYEKERTGVGKSSSLEVSTAHALEPSIA